MILLIKHSGENIWSIFKETIKVLPISNYEDADTGLTFHAGMSNDAKATAGKNTNVFSCFTSTGMFFPVLVYEG